MPACRRCGSRSVEIVFNPLTFVAHVLTHERRTRCPRCGWTGWKHKKEWAHVAGAGIWRGAGGIQGNGHHRQSNSTHRVNDTPPDAVFEKVAGSHEPLDLGAIDRALDEHERKRTERHTPRQAATSPSRATHDRRKKPSRKKESRAPSIDATLMNRDSHGSARSTHSAHGSTGRSRISRRALRGVERNRVILLVLAAVAALVVVVLTARACGGDSTPSVSVFRPTLSV